MTQSERATAVLNYLEGLDAKTVINILNPMLDDEALELVYMGLVRDGVIEGGDDDDEEQDGTKAALDYVRGQLDPEELAAIHAQIDRAYRYHMSPSHCVTNDDKVIDLLEEYGEENSLPEGWWMNEGDIDDWLLKL